uniref:Uncharacterized protein n=1 Tax=Oncorhynchus kisutch TaxID=8019 RepID=A0A8C7IAD2_ONCKI
LNLPYFYCGLCFIAPMKSLQKYNLWCVSFLRSIVTMTCPGGELMKKDDSSFTLDKRGVIFIVYSWAQKKSGPAAPQKQTYRSAGRGPPVVPSPDYEPLSVATCSRDIYATHRTG